MLHYYFPSYSVGEVRPIRGPGRREIGHGCLAERSVERVIPLPERFPYTIRMISDITESNGSSSMASVCSATLAMMDAGVPIVQPVAGISIGLVKETDDKYTLLTDIMGDEDHFGDMDFKVAGTQRGVTGIQLDLKIDGISERIIRDTLQQAARARRELLKTMLSVIRKPRGEISPYAPRLTQIKIDPEKIGLLIGPGGKTIRSIQESAGVTIDVQDDGTVTVAGANGPSVEEAPGQYRGADGGNQGRTHLRGNRQLGEGLRRVHRDRSGQRRTVPYQRTRRRIRQERLGRVQGRRQAHGQSDCRRRSEPRQAVAKGGPGRSGRSRQRRRGRRPFLKLN